MTEHTDQDAIDREMSAWAESDAAVDAPARSTAPRDTAASRAALDAFRQAQTSN